MNPNWLLRMAQWARHPPSPGRVKLVFGVVVICLVLFGIEHWIGWPEWLRVNPQPRLKF
jgi:hypothetical protein